MNPPTDDADDRRDRRSGPNEEPKLMTHIDGEEVRLLVHIEPIEEAGGGTTEPVEPDQESPPKPPGLAQ